MNIFPSYLPLVRFTVYEKLPAITMHRNNVTLITLPVFFLQCNRIPFVFEGLCPVAITGNSCKQRIDATVRCSDFSFVIHRKYPREIIFAIRFSSRLFPFVASFNMVSPKLSRSFTISCLFLFQLPLEHHLNFIPFNRTRFRPSSKQTCSLASCTLYSRYAERSTLRRELLAKIETQGKNSKSSNRNCFHLLA